MTDPTFLVLTDYGAKTAHQLADPGFTLPQGFTPQEEHLIVRLFAGPAMTPCEVSPALVEKLRQQGILTLLATPLQGRSLQHLLKRSYRTSPVIHTQVLVIEYTTRCNLGCRHCYKAGLPIMTESRPDGLKAAIDEAKRMGIGYYLFNGGEVTRYGKGWLAICRHIAQTGHPVSVITNGWWGMDGEITTEERTYAHRQEYLEVLKEAGIRQIVFSVDGLGEEHDRYRNNPGLFDKVLTAVKATRAAGIVPKVSIVLHEGIADPKRFFDEVTRIFDLKHNPSDYLGQLHNMPETGILLAGQVDIGRASQPPALRARAPYALDNLECLNGFCKGITRGVKLSVRVNGEVESCTLGVMGDGYGTIQQQSLTAIINQMRHSLVYQIHQQNRFADYVPYIDRSIFGDRFFHRCTILSIIQALAPRIEAAQHQGKLTPDHLRTLNEEVGKLLGFGPIP